MTFQAGRRPERLDFHRPLGAAALERVLAAVRAGEVMALPTETLWGLSADPFSSAAAERLAVLKGRGPGKPVLVLIGGWDDLDGLGVVVAEPVRRALRRLWPAPVTVILPLVRPLPAAGGGPGLAVRMPDHDLLRSLLARTGPLSSTSANRAGEAPALTAEEIERLFGDRLALILDGDVPIGSRPSTLVDALQSPPLVVRPGAGEASASAFVSDACRYAESL